MEVSNKQLIIFINLELREAFWARGLNVRVGSEKTMLKAMGVGEIA